MLDRLARQGHLDKHRLGQARRSWVDKGDFGHIVEMEQQAQASEASAQDY